MADSDKLNNDANLLAKAMRQVFTEAVEGTVEPLHTEIKAAHTEMHDMEVRLDKKIDDGRRKAVESR
ncbi:MAG: hypothetical protein F4114_18110 [Rhodospirillaceae bacterium]|nr:hypothetical protein [Rhodospirillaceae bacterium]MYB13277.1 hypothetical protein [Rhodospirillaceae bacterium]MYI50984.1 hypothetical protein [Rhodospirillaceae bacterium]